MGVDAPEHARTEARCPIPPGNRSAAPIPERRLRGADLCGYDIAHSNRQSAPPERPTAGDPGRGVAGSSALASGRHVGAGQRHGAVRKRKEATVARRPRVSALATGDHRFGEQVPTRWTRATVYDDMWVDPADDPRENAGPVVDELTLLLEYLRTQRLTLSMKCADLDADGLAARSVPHSTMSLLGLVRHMADVERSWSRRVMGPTGRPAPLRHRRRL